MSIKDLIAHEAEATENAEAMADGSALPEGTKVTRGHGRSRTLQIRLNGDEYEQVQLLAKSQHLPVSTVARILLLTALAPSDDIESALNRLELDIATVRRQLAQG